MGELVGETASYEGLRPSQNGRTNGHSKAFSDTNLVTVDGRGDVFTPYTADRVLLINPPIYDTRLPWKQWQQPTLLLRLAQYYRQANADVKLVDAMYRSGEEKLRRERVEIMKLPASVGGSETVDVYKWRLGISRYSLSNALKGLKRERWTPEVVYVECFTTYWWEGAQEATEAAHSVFPEARIVLVGAYARLAADHARTHTAANDIVGGADRVLAHLPADLSVYERRPRFAYVSLGNGQRSADEIVNEVVANAANRGAFHFAFSDHRPMQRHKGLFLDVLERLAGKGLKVNFYALGNLASEDIVEEPELASLMKSMRFEEIHLADDRDRPLAVESDEQFIESSRRAAMIFGKAGFAIRTKAVSGSMCIGRTGEDFAARARVATMLAHHLGSVIMWPYQPSPEECPDVSLEKQNGKLFPLASKNGLTYRDYMDFLGLGAVLNAKHRDRTFDFLGGGLIAGFVRHSFEHRGWDPEPEVKGVHILQLPMARR